eukprot:3359553-Pyramimonas_sp.AAC.1
MSSLAAMAERVSISDDGARETFDRNMAVVLGAPHALWKYEFNICNSKAKPDFEQLAPWWQTIADIFVKTQRNSINQ